MLVLSAQDELVASRASEVWETKIHVPIADLVHWVSKWVDRAVSGVWETGSSPRSNKSVFIQTKTSANLRPALYIWCSGGFRALV